MQMDHKDEKRQKEIVKERIGDLQNLNVVYQTFEVEKQLKQAKMNKEQ